LLWWHCRLDFGGQSWRRSPLLYAPQGISARSCGGSRSTSLCHRGRKSLNRHRRDSTRDDEKPDRNRRRDPRDSTARQRPVIQLAASGTPNDESDERNENRAKSAGQHSNPGKRPLKRHQELTPRDAEKRPDAGLRQSRKTATARLTFQMAISPLRY